MQTGKIILIIVGVLILALAIRYLTLNKSRKQYIKSIIKQIPYLRSRYSV